MLNVRVVSKWVEAVDICALELVSASGDALPPFSAGAHVDVHLPDGLVRQYSLCNSPEETHRYVLGVLRDPESQGGSAAIHEVVKEGDLLQVSEPKNFFPLKKEAKRSLLFAGGIGITPILCMAEQLAIDGDDFEMHYSARSRDRAAFVSRIEESAFKDRVRFHFDGRADIEALLGNPQSGTHIYVCGPKGFMDHVVDCAHKAGWQEHQIHREVFEGDHSTSDDNESFQVKIASSGRAFTIPADQKITSVLADNGIDIPTSCTQGVCGTCLTRIVEGEPDHRDFYLTPDEHQENKVFLPCCSRSKSDLLVLDL